ncbi:hypothetical protein Tco_1352121 [Tanacetum coccineum]
MSAGHRGSDDGGGWLCRRWMAPSTQWYLNIIDIEGSKDLEGERTPRIVGATISEGKELCFDVMICLLEIIKKAKDKSNKKVTVHLKNRDKAKGSLSFGENFGTSRKGQKAVCEEW